VAEAIADHGIDVVVDLRELWARIAFSIAINNTDDHLRNHGFLRRGAGWTLSPMFDVNPDPSPGSHRATSLRGAVAAAECLAALFDSCERFGVDRTEAEQTWRDQLEVIGRWRDVAHERGISEDEVGRFASVLDRWQEA
jgi:serine/threonine-protein kinase HipA